MKAEISSECKLVIIPENRHESLLLDYFFEAFAETEGPEFVIDSLEMYEPDFSEEHKGRAYLIKKEAMD